MQAPVWGWARGRGGHGGVSQAREAARRGALKRCLESEGRAVHCAVSGRSRRFAGWRRVTCRRRSRRCRRPKCPVECAERLPLVAPRSANSKRKQAQTCMQRPGTSPAPRHAAHLLHVGAGNAGVVVQAGVAPHRLLPRVRELRKKRRGRRGAVRACRGPRLGAATGHPITNRACACRPWHRSGGPPRRLSRPSEPPQSSSTHRADGPVVHEALGAGDDLQRRGKGEPERKVGVSGDCRRDTLSRMALGCVALQAGRGSRSGGAVLAVQGRRWQVAAAAGRTAACTRRVHDSHRTRDAAAGVQLAAAGEVPQGKAARCTARQPADPAHLHAPAAEGSGDR